MQGLFDIIGDYWMWILLVLVIIGFAYIGYYAEKKGYLGKEKKNNNKGNGNIVNIDELSMAKDTTKAVKENKEEDLSNSFDEMPDIVTNEKQDTKAEEVSEEIPEELFAPFGDDAQADIKVETPSEDVSEVVEDDYNQEFVNLDNIVDNAKDIHDTKNKKDVSELMKGEEQIDLSFDVEGSSDSVKTDNIFAGKKKENEDKKEEVIDDMWKF